MLTRNHGSMIQCGLAVCFVALLTTAGVVFARHPQYVQASDPHYFGNRLLTVFGTEEVFDTSALDREAKPTASLIDFHDNHPEGAFSQYLVHLKYPITQRVKEEVNAHLHPYHLDQYFPHNSFFIAGPSRNHKHHSSFVAKLASCSFVVHYEEWTAARKLEPNMIRDLEAADEDVVSDVLVELDQGTLILQALSDFPELRTATYAEAPRFMSREDRSRVALHMANKLVLQHQTLLDVGATVSSHYLLHIPSTQHQKLKDIAALSFVHWVEKKQQVQMQNKFVHSVVQDNNGSSTRFYDAGIHGEGQIIAIGDTGIDYDSCFFYDPKRPTPIGGVDQNHRKIVTYIEFGSAGDEAHGHGTHTAGTLAGEVLTTDVNAMNHLSPYNGIAYKAKLAAYDFKRPDSELLYTPNDLYQDFFKNSYDAGARIASNSWGAAAFYYDSFARFTDRFLHDYKDYIALYAAGNYGDRGLGTVTTPGSSKNCVAVGSCKSSPSSWHELGFGLAIGSVQGGTTVSLSFIPATFGSRVADFSPVTAVTAVQSTVAKACSPMPSNLNGKIVVVERGDCAFTVKAKNVQDSGGVFMVLKDYDGTYTPVKMGGDDPSITIPCVAVTPSSANAILQNPVTIPVPTDLDPQMNQDHLSSFSSRGPTYDGRTKPDIVAPGQFLLSVDSDGSSSSYQCPSVGGLLEMQGTSMATPASAGTTALVRQYFTDGFYPSGVKTLGDAMIPSGPLLKAVLMNTGVPLTSLTEPIPSVNQGYGRIELGTVLPLAGPSNLLPTNYKLIVKDEHTGVNTLESLQYCLKVTETASLQQQTSTRLYNTPFKASISWYDAAASASAGSLLVNNLDLSVFSVQTNQVYLGNDEKFTEPNTHVTHILADNLNTAEQVAINSVQDGDYIGVKVYGKNVPMGPQPFGLAISGFVEEVPLSNCAGHLICPNSCSSRGTCGVDGICKCNAGFTGPDCSIVSRVTPLVNSAESYMQYSASNAVASQGWAYFHVDVTEEVLAALSNSSYALAMEVGMTRLINSGDPDLYIRYGDFPDLTNFEFYSAECEPCGRTSQVTIPEVKAGRYYIGVYGYCCSDSQARVDVKIHWVSEAPPSNKPKTSSIVGIVLGVLAIIVFVFVGVWYFKTRHQRAGFMQVNADQTALSESLADDIAYIPPQAYTGEVYPVEGAKPPPPSEPRPAYASAELTEL